MECWEGQSKAQKNEIMNGMSDTGNSDKKLKIRIKIRKKIINCLSPSLLFPHYSNVPPFHDSSSLCPLFRDRFVTSCQDLKGSLERVNVSSISFHASSNLFLSSGKSTASPTGERIALGFPWTVIMTFSPCFTERRTSPVLFFKSLAVITFILRSSKVATFFVIAIFELMSRVEPSPHLNNGK